MSKLSINIWGPSCWTLLHISAANLENDRIVEYIKFLRGVSAILPCPECRAHLKKYIEQHPPETIKTPLEASQYAFDLHNHVNRLTGKPIVSNKILELHYGVRFSANTHPPQAKANPGYTHPPQAKANPGYTYPLAKAKPAGKNTTMKSMKYFRRP